MENDNWREGWDEDLKNDPSLKDFDGPKSLARSYSNLHKSHSARHEGIRSEDDWDTIHKKSSKFNHLPEDSKDYNSEASEHAEVVNVLGYKTGLHPKQAKRFAEEFSSALKKHHETLTASQLEDNKKAIAEKYKALKDKDFILSEVASRMDMDVDGLKNKLGKAFYDPLVRGLIYNYGKALRGGKSDGSKDYVTTSHTTVEAQDSDIQAKYNWMQKQMADKKGPFYDPNHKDRADFLKKDKEYTKALKEHEKKTGQKVIF